MIVIIIIEFTRNNNNICNLYRAFQMTQGRFTQFAKFDLGIIKM